MPGAASIVTLPVRLGIRAARLALDGLRSLAGSGDSSTPPVPERTRVPAEPVARRPEPVEPPAPPHVSEQPVPVATFAEPGAEGGAGAQIEIAEPWQGYDRMTVAEIVDQLSAAEVEAAAAVRLYEAAGRARTGVLEAAERRLRMSHR